MADKLVYVIKNGNEYITGRYVFQGEYYISLIDYSDVKRGLPLPKRIKTWKTVNNAKKAAKKFAECYSESNDFYICEIQISETGNIVSIENCTRL